MAKTIAVVTGASSGLGAVFTQKIPEKYELDEIWVIARRKEKLEELASSCSIPLRILPLDLTDAASFSYLDSLLKEENPDIRLLVNAAGFGKMGNYAEISAEDSVRMIDLNCRAAVSMTNLCLPYMHEKAGIIQIASTAAMQPLPRLGIYAASKSFLLSYSRSLRWELFPRKIRVTAVCPYWIKDTEFIPVTRSGASEKAVKHFPLAGKASPIVSMSLTAVRLNVPVATVGIVSTIHRVASKIIPREALIAIWEGLRRL